MSDTMESPTHAPGPGRIWPSLLVVVGISLCFVNHCWTQGVGQTFADLEPVIGRELAGRAASYVGVVSVVLCFVLPLGLWAATRLPWQPVTRLGRAILFSTWSAIATSPLLAPSMAAEMAGHRLRFMPLDRQLQGFAGVCMFTMPVFFLLGLLRRTTPTRAMTLGTKRWLFVWAVWVVGWSVYAALFDARYSSGLVLHNIFGRDLDEQLRHVIVGGLPGIAWGLSYAYRILVTGQSSSA